VKKLFRRPVAVEAVEPNPTNGLPTRIWAARERARIDDDYRQSIHDWLAANGIDPNRVPLNARASIADGSITLSVLAKDQDGRLTIDPANRDQLLTETITVPMKKRPNYWVRLWLWPKCETCGR